MKLRRLLAASVAAAIATSAMAIVSFAEDKTFSGKASVQSTGNWWDASEPTLTQLIGDFDPASVKSISVTTDNAAKFLYNYATDKDARTVDIAAGETITITDLLLDPDFYWCAFAVSTDNKSYVANFEWTVTADVAAETPEDTTPEAPEATTPEDTTPETPDATTPEAPAEDEAPAGVDWSAYDADAAAAANEAFTLGGNIDLYAALGDNWNKLAKIDATFVWNPEFGWCGGAGIGGGATLADGTNWISGPEYGCANANADLQAAGTATQTIIDITNTPLATIAGVTAEGVSEFGVLMVQNWWNGTEASAAVKALTFYDADGNVLAELTYDVEAPSAPSAPEDTTTETGKGSPDTGVEGIAVAAGVVALAGAAVVASRKRK